MIEQRILIEEEHLHLVPQPGVEGTGFGGGRKTTLGYGDNGNEPPIDPPHNPNLEPEEDNYSKMSSQVLSIITEQINGTLTRQEIEQQWFSLKTNEERLRQNLSGLRRTMMKIDHRIPNLIRVKSHPEKVTPDFASAATKLVFHAIIASDMEPDEIFQILKVDRTQRYELEPKRLIEAALRGKIFLP